MESFWTPKWPQQTIENQAKKLSKKDSQKGTSQDCRNMAPRWVGRGGKVTVDGHKSPMWAKNYPLKSPRRLKTSLSATPTATGTAAVAAVASQLRGMGRISEASALITCKQDEPPRNKMMPNVAPKTPGAPQGHWELPRAPGAHRPLDDPQKGHPGTLESLCCSRS